LVVLFYMLGMGNILRKNLTNAGLLLSWILVPLMVVSTASGKHGGLRHIVFLLPGLSLCAGSLLASAQDYLSKRLQSKKWNESLSAAVLGSALLSNLLIFPYQVDYYNIFVGGPGKAQERYSMGDAGIGSAPGFEYLDKHAPQGSRVQVYASKANAYYHSRRVDVIASQGTQSVFYHRDRTGTPAKENYPLGAFRSGDLLFDFPYYFEDEFPTIADSIKNGIDYVLICRNLLIPGKIAQGHSQYAEEIRSQLIPVFVHSRFGVNYVEVYELPLEMKKP